MAIEFVGSIGGSYATVGNRSGVAITPLSGGISTTIQQDDCLIVLHANASGANRQPSVTGFTEIADLYVNDLNDAAMWVGYLRAGSSPPSTIDLVVSTGGSTSAQTWIVYVFRGVDWSQPLDVTADTEITLSDRAPDPPPLTPVTAGAVIVAAGASAHAGGALSFSSSDLTGFVSQSANASSFDSSLGIGYANWTSGAFDPAPFTISGTSTDDSWVAVTFALRPASSGSTTDAVGTATASGAATGAGQAVAGVAGASGGVATATGAAQAVAGAAGDASGSATASGNGRAVVQGVGTAAGAASGAGASAADGSYSAASGTAIGIATAGAEARAITATQAAAVAGSGAVGTSRAVIAVRGDSISAASVVAVGVGIAVAVGAAVGAATATAVGADGSLILIGRRYARPSESRNGGRLIASANGGMLGRNRPSGGRISRG